LKNRQQQLGVTLIEVLITIVIMAFGLLGVVLMQTISLKSNHEASQRHSAINLSNDIITRMQSVPLANLSEYNKDSDNVSSANDCTLGSKCSVSNKIKSDLWQWKQLLANSSSLVNAAGCISINENQIQVIISWDGIGKAKNSSTTSCGTAGSAFKRRSLTLYTIH